MSPIAVAPIAMKSAKMHLFVVCYWPSYVSRPGRREIEFLAESDGAVEPIEVKASRNRSISLDTFLERGDVITGYKLVDGNVGQVDKKIALPHYLASILSTSSTTTRCCSSCVMVASPSTCWTP